MTNWRKFKKNSRYGQSINISLGYSLLRYAIDIEHIRKVKNAHSKSINRKTKMQLEYSINRLIGYGVIFTACQVISHSQRVLQQTNNHPIIIIAFTITFKHSSTISLCWDSSTQESHFRNMGGH